MEYKNIKTPKRQLELDKVFFGMALSYSQLSKDNKFKVGSLIVDTNNKVVSMGYNGPPSCFHDDVIDFSGNVFEIKREINPEVYKKLFGNAWLHTDVSEKIYSDSPLYDGGDTLGFNFYTHNKHKKGPFMIHAEQNAILTADEKSRLKGATIYVTLFPCPVCVSMIAQSGIKTIKTLNNKTTKFNEFIKDSLTSVYLNNLTLEVFTNEDLEKE